VLESKASIRGKGNDYAFGHRILTLCALGVIQALYYGHTWECRLSTRSIQNLQRASLNFVLIVQLRVLEGTSMIGVILVSTKDDGTRKPERELDRTTPT
jgi:hypothetical protein